MPPKKHKDDDSDDDDQGEQEHGRVLPDDWKPGMPLPLPKISGDDDSEDDSDDESDKALVRTKYVPAWAADSKALRFLPGSPGPKTNNNSSSSSSSNARIDTSAPIPSYGGVPQAPMLEGYGYVPAAPLAPGQTEAPLPPLPPGPPPNTKPTQQQQQQASTPLPPLPPGPPPNQQQAQGNDKPPASPRAQAQQSPSFAANSIPPPRALSPSRSDNNNMPPPPPASPSMSGGSMKMPPPPPPMSLGASSISSNNSVQPPPPPPPSMERTLSRAGSRYGDVTPPPPPPSAVNSPPPPPPPANSKAWVIHVDPNSHQPYFYNTDTGESTWTQPVGFQPPPPPPTPVSPPRERALSPAASKRNLLANSSPRGGPTQAPEEELPPPPPAEEYEQQQYTYGGQFDYEMKESDNTVVQFDFQAFLARTDKIVTLEDYVEHLAIPKKKTFRKQTTLKELIEHHKEIEEPLVANPEIKKETALQLFKNITGFMGDRATSKHPDLHINKLVRTVLRGVKPLRDEAYCQLLKQLTGNRDMKSRRRGWTLLSMIAGVVPPTTEFWPYLEGYIRRTAKVETDPEIIAHIKYIMFIMPKTNARGARTYAPCEAEIDAVRFCRPMMIRVATLDKKFEDIEVWAQDTVAELQERFENRRGYRGLPVTKDGESCFGIFQALKEEFKKKEGWGGVPVDIEEFLGGSARVADVICRWFIGLEAKPGQIPEPKFRLVYKAKMTLGHQIPGVMENLSPDALYLYYLNAKSDLIHAAFQLGDEQCIKLAALQIQYQEGDEKEHRNDDEEDAAPKKKNKKRFKGDDLEFYVPKPVWKAIGFHRNKKKGKIRDQNDKVKEFVQKILVARRQLRGMAPMDCLRSYLDTLKAQLLYGCNFYVVEHVVDTEKVEWDKLASKAGGDIMKILKNLDKKHNAVKGPSHVCMALSELGVFFLGLPKMDTKFMLKSQSITHIQAAVDNISFVGDKPGGARVYFFRTLQARKIEKMIQLFHTYGS